MKSSKSSFYVFTTAFGEKFKKQIMKVSYKAEVEKKMTELKTNRTTKLFVPEYVAFLTKHILLRLVILWNHENFDLSNI